MMRKAPFSTKIITVCITRLYVSCTLANGSWDRFSEWISEVLQINVVLCPVDIMLGKIGKKFIHCASEAAYSSPETKTNISKTYIYRNMRYNII